MENKVITTLNPSFIQNIECVLTRGNQFIQHTTLRFNLMEFADFLKAIENQDQDQHWKPMKVSHQGKMKDNPEIRSSKVNKNIHISFTKGRYCPQTISINYKSYYVIDNDLIKFDTASLVNGISNFMIIRYDEGDHFDEFHYDTQHTKNSAKSIGTTLLFPPADISPFTGGDLIFKIENGDQVSLQTIYPSKFKEWTLITFGHVLHKCTPVLSGTRYVFKAEIWSMYPDIMKPVELSIESITSFIKEKQSRKLELLSQARYYIADLYSTYLEDIRIKLEARKRAILKHPDDKIMVLSTDTISDIHYKPHSIIMNMNMNMNMDMNMDNNTDIESTRDNKCKEASLLHYYENTMHIKLDILKINYNNLIIFLNDENDVYLDIEQILATRDFSTRYLSLKYNGNGSGNGNGSEDAYNDNEINIEFDETLKTVFVLSSLYKEPYDFNTLLTNTPVLGNTFDIKHLKLLRQIINSGYKFTLFNRRYEMFVPIYDWSYSKPVIRIEIDRTNFNWIFEYPKYPGVMLNKESEYNDEGGCDDTFTFESTCILIWRTNE